MNDLLRILVVGYLVRKFLAPKVYPAFDEIIDQLPTVPTLPTLPAVTPPKVEIPITEREELLLVDKGQLIIEPELIYDEVSYPRRRT
tara:strand:- start:153 stop:413 length:261 start_codon:yes stop_codon:yes gene_type:complete